MKAPYRVRQLFATVLQQVHRFKGDVIAGDANAAACKCYKNQEYQYLYNSAVALMLREMQPSDLDGCFMAILSCGNHLDPES